MRSSELRTRRHHLAPPPVRRAAIVAVIALAVVLGQSGKASASTCSSVAAVTGWNITTSPLTGTATATFSILPGCTNVPIAFASYEASSSFSSPQAGDVQTVFGSNASPPNTLGVNVFNAGGPYTLTINAPLTCFFQIDLAVGTVIPVLSFPASVYGNFLVQSVHGGTTACQTTTGTPNLTLTKTADNASITAGQTAGFTVKIASDGTADATGVSLSDPLPAGGDLNWSIASQSPAGAFQISGPVGSQTLSLTGQPVTIPAGTTWTVDVTSPTTATDAAGSGGSTYSVLYTGTGGNTLHITNVSVGNVGVGGTGKVNFDGPGAINGRLDFSASNVGQFHNSNNKNVGPTSVNYNVAAVTAALNNCSSVSSSLQGKGNNLALNGNQTVNESAGQLVTVGGVTYRVFNVTSYSENDGKLLTINGDGSGDPVVFNFGANQNLNLGGDVALTGGLTDSQVLWNFTSTNQNIQLNNNASSFKTLFFRGAILAPNDAISIVNTNLSGSVCGGGTHDMQIVSGDNIVTPTPPLVNTATLTAANITIAGSPASASITVN